MIRISWPWELPEHIDGIAVVCDVWGSTTNINTLLTKGVRNLFVVNEQNVKEAKEYYLKALVIGESKTLPKDYFHASNYVHHVAQAQTGNKTVLFMSNNGSRVIELMFAKKAKEVLTVSFTNVQAMSEYLKQENGSIYLIPSGDHGVADPKVLEDLLCVETLKKMIEGNTVHLEKVHVMARDFISATYGHQGFDQEANFAIAFPKKTLPVIPLCTEEKEGWIRLTNAAG